MTKRLLTSLASLSLALTTLSSGAGAQVPAGISTNADGSYVTSRAGVNPTADGGGGTVIYGDITTGPGSTVIGAPSVSMAPAAPAPAYSPDDASLPAETGAADSSPADVSDTDLDGDNIADSLEWNLGLDSGNADTDADGVADGDEISIYETDPLSADSDGDGVSDGEELFGIHTDPLVWNERGEENTEALAQQGENPEAVPAATGYDQVAPATTRESVTLSQGTTQDVTAVDGDAAVRGNGGASASPGTVTRGGNTTRQGPAGSSIVTDAPSNVQITGDTHVIAPLDESSNASLATDSGAVYSCGAYGDWYDAQIAYENAGATAADPAMVQALDPDYDGIACEESMA